MRLGVSQSRTGQVWRRENLFLQLGFKPLKCLASSQLLYQLCCLAVSSWGLNIIYVDFDFIYLQFMFFLHSDGCHFTSVQKHLNFSVLESKPKFQNWIVTAVVKALLKGDNELYDSNKSTNQMQQFHKFITWCSCVAQHVLGTFPPIIRSIQLH